MRRAARHVAAGTLCALAAGLAAPASACDGGPLFELMEARLPAHPDKNFDVAEVDSTEGGNWDVYYGPDGKTPRFVVRTDYGESGYWQSRLIVSSPDAYAITATTYMYSAPNYTSGSTVIRERRTSSSSARASSICPRRISASTPPMLARRRRR